MALKPYLLSSQLASDTPTRKRDAEATRAAMLEAAKAQFAQLGYDRTTLRGIAALAGADVALIKRYFGGKEALFTSALEASFRDDFTSEWDHRTLPQELATMMADNLYRDEERIHRFQFLLRAATSPTTAPLLNVAIQERFLGPIRNWLGSDDAAARARVLAAVVIGLLVERLIRNEPLTGQERVVFIEQTTTMLKTIVQPPTSELATHKPAPIARS
ncbi:MAG: TetR/AcrR family transcriptional regulator [Gammaproteobacteria bacterium]|nr:TetR/AcrR family transcriptional regulator [Gammaproteobacteria bacterium]